jgi:hypothetical protein
MRFSLRDDRDRKARVEVPFGRLFFGMLEIPESTRSSWTDERVAKREPVVGVAGREGLLAHRRRHEGGRVVARGLRFVGADPCERPHE